MMMCILNSILTRVYSALLHVIGIVRFRKKRSFPLRLRILTIVILLAEEQKLIK